MGPEHVLPGSLATFRALAWSHFPRSSTCVKTLTESAMRSPRSRQELLEFTQGLDFSKYIKDAEVQSMIDQVKRRIAEIERQSESEDRGDGRDRAESTPEGVEEEEARLEVRRVPRP